MAKFNEFEETSCIFQCDNVVVKHGIVQVYEIFTWFNFFGYSVHFAQRGVFLLVWKAGFKRENSQFLDLR